MCKYIGIRNKYTPRICTVKKECNKRFASGPNGEICAVRNCINCHINSTCLHETGSQHTHVIGSIVYIRNDRRQGSKNSANHNADKDIEKYKPPCGLLCARNIVSSESLTNHNSSCVTHGKENYLEQIRYGAKALDAKAKAEMANYFPTIYGFGMYDVFDHYRSAIDPKWAVGIGASFTIFNGMRRTNDYQAAKAESESYNALAAEIERKIELGVRNYYMEMKLAENSYLMLEDAIQQATENLRLNEKRYETGLGTSIEVLDAELSLEAIKLKRNNALKDYYSNLVQICKIINNNDYFLNIWEKNN